MPENRRNEPLKPGEKAPQFTLPFNANPGAPGSRDFRALSLQELQGRRVVLVFYPADFSPVCTDELSIYNELLPEWERLNARILGISVDGVWCHAAFARDRKLRFPLLADFEPKGRVSRLYNSYREGDGFSERSLYVLDEDGVVAFSHLSPIEVNPGVDGVLETLERMSARDGGREASP